MSASAPLSPLHELGGNLHDLADIVSLQNGDTSHSLPHGRLPEASERFAEVSDPALRAMLEEIAAGRVPSAALFSSLGCLQDPLLQVSIRRAGVQAGLEVCQSHLACLAPAVGAACS